MSQPPLASESTRLSCPHCGAEVSTETKAETGRCTHITAVVLFLLGCWCCCCIPYFTEGTKDIEHTCPNCHKFIGIFKR